MNLREIAEFLGGELIGKGDVEISGVSGISDAGEGDITFISGPKYAKMLKESSASAVIVKELIPGLDRPQIKVNDPYYAFARLLERFYVRPAEPSGVSSLAFVSEDASLGEGVSVYPFSYISGGASIGKGSVIHPCVFIGENSKVGENCTIYPNVVIREGVTIGSRVIIHPGAVIGSDGFGYTFHEGVHYKIPQVGGVIIGDDAEIGAGVAIDRATTGSTVIGRGTKIDNLVQIGHNVKIGDNSIIVAQVGVGGSTEIGNFVTIGGQTGISDHSRIEDGVMIGAQSGVMGEVKKGVYSGSPVIPHIAWLKAVSLFSRLPELSKRIRLLEEKIDEIERRRRSDGD
ncbi:MAG: UDP-3-O-(3-hydroxymyristoyl)glucosamine N-acyltransferase [Thermodesulfovibrionales bacterium]|nr:UDP-3-O-(3-hydroxymyristoyl)glucosamine N-acyltransferase [Thermodesulfovibrionales bacterium]